MKPTAQMSTAATPADVGYRPERIDVLDNFLWKLIDEKQLQCATYAMARNNSLFVCKGMGKLHYDPADDRVCGHDSLTRMASITKMFTAVAIMKLVEDGLLEITSPLSAYLKEFDYKEYEDITLIHLLTHTSGLAFDAGEDGPYSLNWWDLCTEKNAKYNWVEAILATSVVNKPGQIWAYSSTGYTLMGEIIRRVTGMRAEDYIIDNIIKPLNMQDTHFGVPEEKWDRVIVTAEWGDPRTWAQQEEKERQENAQNGRRELVVPRTSSGIYSTAYDITLFGLMLANNGVGGDARILHRKTVEMMRRDFAYGARDYCWGAKGNTKYYGLGPQLYGRNNTDLLSPGTYGHEGAGRSAIYIDPEENFVAVNFVPTKEAWLPQTVLNLRNVMWSGLL